MRTNLKLFGSSIAVCLTVVACEKNDQDLKPESVDLKNANNGMIKSYDNNIVLKWDEAIGQAVDNKMPPATESTIYAMVTLAMHDALNNVVPKYETYAKDNIGVDSRVCEYKLFNVLNRK